MPWHVWCHHHSQCAASQRTLACSREALKWKDGACHAPEEVPASSPQDRGGRILNRVGEEAGCFSFVLPMMCAERRNSLCPTLQACQGIQGGVLRGNDLRLARGWAFGKRLPWHLFPTLPVCIRTARNKKVCFFPLPPFQLHWWKWVASGLKQWQQEEKSTKTAAVGNHNTVDIET